MGIRKVSDGKIFIKSATLFVATFEVLFQETNERGWFINSAVHKFWQVRNPASVCRTESYVFRETMGMRFCCLLLCCILLLDRSAPVVANGGSDYLDQKERDVVMIEVQASINDGRQCVLAASCGDFKYCSHQSCAPLLGDATSSSCVNVKHNKYCSISGTSNSTCSNMKFDYRSSYVRLPNATKMDSADTVLAICAQRELDSVFKNISTPSVLTRVYFGSVDGTWRTFPGSAQSENCGAYDARVRSWYRTSTSVTKIVMILIDIGASMSSNLSPGLGAGTILQAAKRIVAEFLRTLSGQDYVNIILFDSTRIIQLSPSPVLVEEHNGTVGPKLQSLMSELDKQTVETQSRQSNLPAAMNAALKSYDSNPLAAKAMMVITDGMFAALGNVTSLPTANLSSLGVKVFTYKIPQTSDRDIFWTNNSALISQLCDIGGHFEPILKNLDNPLLVLRKFFSYFANLKRASTGGKPLYSYIFEDYDKIGGNITTVTKPAFAPSGELIGVAGITIYIESLGNITDQVKQILNNKKTGNSYLETPIVLSAANCTIVSKNIEPCEGSTHYDSNGGVCPRTDFDSSIKDLTCCGNCQITEPPTDSSRVRIVVVVVIVIVIFVMILCLIGYVVKQRCNEQRLHQENVYPPDREAPRRRRGLCVGWLWNRGV